MLLQLVISFSAVLLLRVVVMETTGIFGIVVVVKTKKKVITLKAILELAAVLALGLKIPKKIRKFHKMFTSKLVYHFK